MSYFLPSIKNLETSHEIIHKTISHASNAADALRTIFSHYIFSYTKHITRLIIRVQRHANVSDVLIFCNT